MATLQLCTLFDEVHFDNFDASETNSRKLSDVLKILQEPRFCCKENEEGCEGVNKLPTLEQTMEKGIKSGDILDFSDFRSTGEFLVGKVFEKDAEVFYLCDANGHRFICEDARDYYAIHLAATDVG